MKLVEFEVMLTFIGSLLGLIAFTSYLTDVIYPSLLYASVFCLFAAKWIELVERIDFE